MQPGAQSHVPQRQPKGHASVHPTVGAACGPAALHPHGLGAPTLALLGSTRSSPLPWRTVMGWGPEEGLCSVGSKRCRPLVSAEQKGTSRDSPGDFQGQPGAGGHWGRPPFCSWLSQQPSECPDLLILLPLRRFQAPVFYKPA